MDEALKVNGLIKNFGNLKAVNQLSFQVEKGELFGIVGANGAGKTTLFNLLMGDFKQDSGSIRFEGMEISTCMKHTRVKMGLSRTHQIPRPFLGMSVVDNIRIGGIPNTLKTLLIRDRDQETAEIIAGQLGLKEDLKKFPGELSLAKTKKLEFARALATNPKLMLVDEVFAGISPVESDELAELILDLNGKGVTIILIDHNLRILTNLVQRMMAIDFGQKIAEGKPGEVTSDKRVIEAYLGAPIKVPPNENDPGLKFSDPANSSKTEVRETDPIEFRPGTEIPKLPDVLEKLDKVRTKSEKKVPLLKVDNLEAFYGNAQAVKGVSFEIEKSNFVSFIGANGAGKSTIVDSISNLIHWRGKILFDHLDLKNLKPSEIVQQGIINCPERRNIFPFMSVKENLLMGAYNSKHNAKENFEFVFDLFPRLSERLEQEACTLSGGEQRMLALGRSLMSNPKFLMVDEPTLGLAPVLVKQLSQALVRLRKKLTILLMEQNVNLALDLSDKIYVLEMGRIVKCGTPTELQSEDSIREIYLPQERSTSAFKK
jgi:branched-chain amino acid transport system ATP-binding protein